MAEGDLPEYVSGTNAEPVRPFRFGLTIGSAAGRTAVLEVIRRAEDAGFDVICGVDHIGPPLGVLPLLGAVTAISKLRVSPMVIANDYRHPVILAKDCATIDVLSDGRFELGIGTGWIRDHYQSAGISFDPPGLRVERLEEAIAVIKGCWSAQPFSFRGAHYQVDLVGSPAPVQLPHPPLLVAGAGPRMLRLAGREADIVGITLTHGHSGFDTFVPAIATSGDRIEEQLDWVRAGAGDRFASIELSVMIHFLVAADDTSVAARDFADEIGASAAGVLDSPHVLMGSPARMAEVLLERREKLGLSYIVFRGVDLDAAAPVVEILAGR